MEKFMLGCLDRKFSIYLRDRKKKTVQLKHRFEIIKTISKPATFKSVDKNVSQV